MNDRADDFGEARIPPAIPGTKEFCVSKARTWIVSLSWTQRLVLVAISALGILGSVLLRSALPIGAAGAALGASVGAFLKTHRHAS